MKNKLIFSSIVAIVLCVSLITGATFALFTSESNVNIAVTSGSVDVKASVAKHSENFVNGGELKIEGSNVYLNNVVPGDSIELVATISNSSTVAFKQRLLLVGDQNNALYDNLIVGISQVYDAEQSAPSYTYYSEAQTDWNLGEVQAKGQTQQSYVYVSISLPEYVGNEAQGLTCKASLVVEAIQANATTTEQASAKLVYFANDQVELDNAVAKAVDGETIILDGGAWTDASVAFDDAKSITLRGYDVENLTVNAPNGSVKIYNNVVNENIIAVAMNSLHVYGSVENLVIEQGRIVVENSAEIAKVTLAPQKADSVVKLEVAVIAPAQEVVAPKIEQVVVNAAVAGAEVVISAPQATTTAPVVPTLPVIECAPESAIQKEDVTHEAVTEYGNSIPVSNSDELNTAIKSAVQGEETVLALADGVYTLKQIGSAQVPTAKNIVIVGTKNAIIDMSKAVQTANCIFTFDGVTLDYHDTANYVGFQHAAKVVYKNCTIYGQLTNYAPEVEFVNCEFVNMLGYNVWTYGANKATFTDCKFISGGRAILVYNEKEKDSFVANVTLTNCDFVSDGSYFAANPTKPKAAVETGSNANNTETSNKYNLVFKGCSVDENYQPNNSDSALWGNKNSMDNDHLKVEIDGVKVF